MYGIGENAVELRHLRYFVAVAEEGSVTKAARRLNMQQPPLSQQIRALETELGVRLFDRVAKRVMLNAAGRQFLDDARHTLDSAAAAVTRVQRFERGERGRVACGFTSSASLHHLAPRLIRAFREAYPLATLDVEERETFELLSGVDQKRLDTAFVRTTGSRFPALESHVLHEEEFVVALPRDHALAAATAPLALKALMSERLVVYRRPDGVGIFDVLMDALRRAGFAPNVSEEVPRIITAINLVAAGQGISLVPASMRALHTESVVYRALAPGSLPPMPLTLVYRRHDPSALVRNFIAVVREACASCDASFFPEL
jgi:DNA-binding transcriptional LysR family regulator